MMKRRELILGAVAVLFLLQLVAVPGLALAESSWDGAPILAQPEGFEDFEGGELTAEEQRQMEEFERQMAAGGAAAMGAVLVFYVVIMCIGLAIQIFICYLLNKAAASIPAEHQQVSPGMVWLFLIPCVNIVMLFIIFPGLVKGFQSYFASQNRTDVGDCGASLIPWFLVSAFLCAPAYLVLLIMLLSKFSGYKNMINEGGAA